MKSYSKIGIFFTLIMFLTTLTILNVCAADRIASHTYGDNLLWTLYNNGDFVISGKGPMPNQSSSTSWDSYRNYIENVIIENGVTTIGDYTFYDNHPNLKSITIANTVTSIGDYAFYGCSRITNINIPNSVISIGNSTFRDCSALANITIGDYVTYIGSSAFKGCSSLITITIPDSVSNIGHSVFENCSSLASISIPNGVTCIHTYTFANCSNLKNVTFGDDLSYIGSYSFSNCSTLENITIGNNIREIESYAFEHCSSLKSISIGNNLTSIGDFAFWNCSALTKIENTNKVKTIGNYAFSYCTALASINLRNNVNSVGNYAFAYCDSLENVTVYSKDVAYGSGVFDNNLTIYGYAGSTTETYAKENNIPFIALVENVAVTSLTLDKTTTTLEIGDTETLTATITPDNATNKNVMWTSSDESVATVVDGVVTAVSAGNATITVTTEDGAKSATCVVTVNAPAVEEPEIPKDAPTLSVVSVQGRSGNTVDVVLEVSNNPGIAMLGFELNYDSSAMTLKAATANSEVFAESDVISGNISKVPYAFTAANYDENTSGNGKLVTFTFEIKSDCAEGDYEISVKNIEVYTIDEEVVDFVAANGKITVKNYIPGDVTGDGNVNRMDLLRLGKYFTGWEVEIDENASDVTGDGKVNRMDLLRLGKYFTGWDVALG